ncbi:hypothetical protein [Rheinheimera sp. 4Y26]|uniref:hypothetical protein n=1 Tax=Rheinheimera sp. 4Y26 TaxID=2977811 RepID=UPI0021B0B725|nr:hypothetical protein [Rheinheimera sp. 4Y26]MCT6699743.1 hypothetical protein [Rheinheimera sp. 4Y26]
MIGFYRRYLQFLQRIAQRRLWSSLLWWGLLVLMVLLSALQLGQQVPDTLLLLPVLVLLWLLLYLLIRAGFTVRTPQRKGQPFRDKLRAFVFGLRLHSLALATLLLLAISLYATVKLLSVVARTLF